MVLQLRQKWFATFLLTLHDPEAILNDVMSIQFRQVFSCLKIIFFRSGKFCWMLCKSCSLLMETCKVLKSNSKEEANSKELIIHQGLTNLDSKGLL